MPHIEANIVPGRDAETKARLVAELTEVVHRVLGNPMPTISVLIREEPVENWGRAGLTKAALDAKRAQGEAPDP